MPRRIYDTRTAQIAASFLSKKWGLQPDALVVTGSGFVMSAVGSDAAEQVRYADVPGLPHGSVAGHEHTFRLLSMHGRNVILCSGRYHLYEGHSPETCGVFVDIAALLGCKRTVLMNAVGGLTPGLRVGSIVLVSDTIDMTFRSDSAVVSNSHGRGLPDSSWRESVAQRCREAGHDVQEGVLAQMLGPSYETRSEVRMLRRLGADVVGMSTVIEARRAQQEGLETIVLSLVTNMLSDTTLPTLDHGDVINAARAANSQLEYVLCCALE